MRQVIRGREIGFEVTGGGPALLLLHPFPFDRRAWSDVAGRLGRRVVTMDFRGFGESALSEQKAEAIVEALAAMRDRPDRTALLPSLRVPSLVLAGADDTVTPPSEARAMAQSIPGAKFVEIAGAGHLSMLEQPDAFVTAL